MKYEDIRDELKTGDILLFSGKGGISDGIKFFTRSQFSHVGMVYRLDDPLDPKGTVFCWESTTLNDLADADTGKLTKGVQRVELSERLERCFAKEYAIRVRQLTKELTDPMVKALNAFRHKVSGRKYEKNVLDLLRSAYDGFLGANKEDLSSLFCSELVAEAFQRMGLLPGETPSDEYTPKDFSSEGRMNLLNGYGFKKEVPITGFKD